MIDFHSHILPGIDDGSADVKESLALMKALKKQRVTIVAATPHYYVTQRSPHRFLEKRAYVFSQLLEALPEDRPDIVLGAEVLYFPGISRIEELPSLCLEGTELLLLEMPFGTWTDYMLREVQELARSGQFTVVLAHIERYLTRRNARVWDKLLEEGVLMQSNAEFFLPLLRRRKALRLLQNGYIQLLGSDCHNMNTRAPRLSEARRTICEYLGTEMLREIDALGDELLEGAILR